MRVVDGPRQNWHRPAIDPLFQSAAFHHGASVIGIVLSGYLADGAVGLETIKARGGIAVVQHPQDAEVSDMPRNALKRVAADYCVPLAEMATLLERLVSVPVPGIGQELRLVGNGDPAVAAALSTDRLATGRIKQPPTFLGASAA